MRKRAAFPDVAARGQFGPEEIPAPLGIDRSQRIGVTAIGSGGLHSRAKRRRAIVSALFRRILTQINDACCREFTLQFGSGRMLLVPQGAYNNEVRQ